MQIAPALQAGVYRREEGSSARRLTQRWRDRPPDSSKWLLPRNPVLKRAESMHVDSNMIT